MITRVKGAIATDPEKTAMKFGGIFRRENIEYWSQLSQIAATLGVIASVLYLGVQMSESATALKSQTHYNALGLIQRPVEMLIADQELAELVEVGERNADALSPAQFKRFAYFEVMAFNGWEYVYLLNKTGAIPIELANATESYFIEVIRTQPGLKKVWSEYKFAWADPFLSHAEETFRKYAPGTEGVQEIRSAEPSQ